MIIMRLQAILLAIIRAIREMHSPIVYRGNVPYLRHPAGYGELPDWHAFHDHVAGYSRTFFRRTHGDDLNSDALDAIIQARYNEALSDAENQRMNNEHNIQELYRLRHAKLLEVRNEYGVLNRMKQQYENEIALLDRREEAYMATLNHQRQQPVPTAVPPEPTPLPVPTAVPPEPTPQPVPVAAPPEPTPQPVPVAAQPAPAAAQPAPTPQPAPAAVQPEPTPQPAPAAVQPEPVPRPVPAAVQPEPAVAPEPEIHEPLPPTLAKKPKPEALPPTIVHVDRPRAVS